MAQEMTKITVHVQPNAGKNSMVGFSDGILRLKIAAPPVEGKANQELIKFLSKLLDIRKSDISLDKGLSGRNKIVTIFGMEQEEVVKRLDKLQAN
jgi:uncharacterized protein